MDGDLQRFREELRRRFSEKTVKNYPGPKPVVSFDTNRLNSLQRLDSMNKIESLAQEGWIDLQKSHVLLEELPEGPGRMRTKADETLKVGGDGSVHENWPSFYISL